MGFAEELEVIEDLSKHEKFAQHASVQGEPFIKFCARHPIFNAEDELVGNIFLLDYGASADDESRLFVGRFIAHG